MTHSAFKGMRDATRGFSSNVVREGTYLVRIDDCDFFETSKGDKWKNTYTILAVQAGDNKVGEVVNTFWNLKEGKIGKDMFQGNIKGFVASVLDCADDQVGEEEIDKVLGEENPLKGHVVLLTSSRRQFKDGKLDERTGEVGTYPVYSFSKLYAPEEIKAAIGEEAVARFFPKGL